MHRPSTDDSFRVALVTGSTSGIGAAIAQRLHDEGFAVILHSRSSIVTGRRMAETWARARYVQADLRSEPDRIRLIGEVLAHWGRLDVLVNNAGTSRRIPHDDLASATSALWQAMHEEHVVAPFHLVALARDALAEAATRGRPGCVINISSHAGVRPKGASIPYAVNKAALNHLTRLLALTLGPRIRVNAVAPGLVDTPMTADWSEARTTWQSRAPMRRSAQPADIAGIVWSLVTNDYLTGEVLMADGGLNLA